MESKVVVFFLLSINGIGFRYCLLITASEPVRNLTSGKPRVAFPTVANSTQHWLKKNNVKSLQFLSISTAGLCVFSELYSYS